MPSGRNLQPIPHNTDSPLASNWMKGKSAERLPPSFETFGLSEGWQRIYDWAVSNGVLAELLVLIDATLISRNHKYLGTVLREITRPVARENLELWQNTDRSARLLYRLSQAVVADRSILNISEPLPVGSPARTQLQKKITSHYLFATFVEQLPPVSQKERDWFASLRLWLFVHAIRRAQAGNLQDKNLEAVARGVRLACDNDLDWRDVIVGLGSSSQSFDEFNAFLRFAADRTASRKSERSSHQAFCKAISAVCRNEHSPKLIGIGDTFPERLSLSYAVPDDVELHLSTSFSNGLEEDPVADVWETGDTDQDEGVLSVSVDPHDSYLHQTLKANGVVLLSAEEIQFLPWSYSRPSPHEKKQLDAWVEHLLASDSAGQGLLGVLVWIAMRTGQSLRSTLDIPISEEVGTGWRLNINTMHLHRRPPMRHSGWQSKTEVERDWVVPVAVQNRLRLPDAVAQTLRTHLTIQGRACVLGELWHEEDAPEANFRRLRPESLNRVTPGMLGNVLPAYLYVRTGDAALARLVSSQPNTGMSAACAYANWSNSTVEGLLGQLSETPSLSLAGSEPPIGGGSRLDPIEALLRPALHVAAERVVQLAAAGDLVRFHNAYVAYIAVVLLAATGARPIRDPFEAIRHFDFDQYFCLINDKSSGDVRDMRMTPVPRTVSRWIQHDYCHYLGLLAQALECAHPRLADEILSLLKSGSRPSMPFLFMLTTDGELNWTSVSEYAIEATELFEWPLPLRLFRHRLAQRLRRHNLDSEIIDAILGHADNAVATHGDESTRIWLHDMSAARTAMEHVFEDLGIPLIKCQPYLVPPDRRIPAKQQTDILFGIKAREQSRTERSDHARNHAHQVIEDFLAGRELDKLDADAVDDLARKLMFSEQGMPRPLASVYYDVFVSTLNKIWRDEGKKLQIKRRFTWATPTPAPFTDMAPGAIALHGSLAGRLDELLNGIYSSRLSLRECAGLSIALLSIDHRICDLTILKDVADGKHFRLVKLKEHYWLEYARTIADNPDNPDLAVRAFPISPRAVSILDRLLSQRKDNEFSQACVPEMLRPIVDLIDASGRWVGPTATCISLAERLAALVNQVNVISWPGVVAAFMAGRISSFALGWRDRLRLEFGSLPIFLSDDTDGSVGGDSSENVLRKGGIRSHSEQNSAVLQDNARRFYKGLRLLLSGQVDALEHLPSPSETSRRRKHTASSESSQVRDISNTPCKDRRRDLTNLGKRYLRLWNGHVSTTVLLLGEWTIFLLARRSRGKDFLALTTIARYLDALSPAFEEAGYQIDLMQMDEEEITEFYSQVLGGRNLENSSYVEGRLGDFHRWAARLGVEAPDWSALPETVAGDAVSPGLLAESEYQTALRLLAHETAVDPHLSLAHAFLLLCCYRFGLRGKECLGLRREDWLDYGNGDIVVLVRSHPARQLKTPAARRQVPLLFKLSELERAVVDRWMLTIVALHGDTPSAYIFAMLPNSPLAIHRLRLVRHVNEVIKMVTGNPRLSLHHARHTAANRIAVELLGLENRFWHYLCKAEGAITRSDLPGILLGREEVTRRSGWAMARFLGHATRATLFRNYLHLMDEWVRVLHHDDLNKASLGRASHVHILDNVELSKPLDTSLLASPPVPTNRVSADCVLQFMHLLALGKVAEDAAAALRLAPAIANQLSKAMNRIGQRMRLTPRKLKQKVGIKKKKNIKPVEQKGDPLEFLRRIGPNVWSRLVTLLKKIESNPLQNQVVLAAPVPIESIASMVGSTRQLVMWQPEHFMLMRAVVNYFGMDDKSFVVVHSANWTDRYGGGTSQAGFEPVDASREGNMQLDSAFEGQNLNRVENRCVFIYKPNKSIEVLDRLEFVVAFLAVAVAMSLNRHS